MDRSADTCPVGVAAYYEKMALSWRALARQAAWQDEFSQLNGIHPIR